MPKILTAEEKEIRKIKMTEYRREYYNKYYKKLTPEKKAVVLEKHFEYVKENPEMRKAQNTNYYHRHKAGNLMNQLPFAKVRKLEQVLKI